MPADDFVGAIALDALGARIPARHGAVRIEHDESIIDDAQDQRAELTLVLAQRFERLLFGGYVTAGDIDGAVVGGHGPLNPAPGPIAMANTVLHAYRGRAARKFCAGSDRGGHIVRMAQLVDVHALDLVLAPAEQSGPGGIDAGEVALEVRDAEQVFRYQPDAVALSAALFDFGLELIGKQAQQIFIGYALGRLRRGDEHAADSVWCRLIGNRAVTDGEA